MFYSYSTVYIYNEYLLSIKEIIELRICSNTFNIINTTFCDNKNDKKSQTTKNISVLKTCNTEHHICKKYMLEIHMIFDQALFMCYFWKLSSTT